MAKLDGQDAIILSIFKGSTEGTNEVSKNVRAAIEDLENNYPGLSVMVMMDQGDYITLIIRGVLQSMIVGAALAILILALFLKDVKPTIVVAVSIPLSVLTALVLMYFSDISLNMMSLSGLSLGIGMLVDNSIVCYRKYLQTPFQRRRGSQSGSSGYKAGGGSNHCLHPDDYLRVPADGIYHRYGTGTDDANQSDDYLYTGSVPVYCHDSCSGSRLYAAEKVR